MDETRTKETIPAEMLELAGIDADSSTEDRAEAIETWEDAEPEARALALHLGVWVSDIGERYGYFTEGKAEYLVLNDSDADDAWDEELERYIDDCLEIPEPLAFYFDREAWKRDARHDGRGHALSSYDGNEDEAEDPETGETYYIFRVN